METVTLTCPSNGTWYIDEKANITDTTYTFTYDANTKPLYYCQYGEDQATKYYFYVKGKGENLISSNVPHELTGPVLTLMLFVLQCVKPVLSWMQICSWVSSLWMWLGRWYWWRPSTCVPRRKARLDLRRLKVRTHSLFSLTLSKGSPPDPVVSVCAQLLPAQARLHLLHHATMRLVH